MKKLKFTLVLLSVVLIFGGCQKINQDENLQNVVTEHQLGALLLPADVYAQLPVVSITQLKSVTALPTSVSLNIPPVGDQGNEGSCVAWGTTYAGRSIMWVKDHTAAWSKSVNIFSPEYVYNQVKVSDCASGAYTVDALKLLVNKGVCTWSTMPYVVGQCSLMPNSAQNTEAAKYKISKYGTVSITTTAIKTWLASGFPVIVAGPVDRNFEYLASGAVLTRRNGNLGGHCYCVVGYDDSKGAFKFQNSWGTSWATAGCGYISYSYITSWWQEAYVLTN